MPRDASQELVCELKRLSNRELRLTLDELKPHERTQVLALIEQADVAKPAPTFEALVGLSPWLLRAIDDARSIDGESGRLTIATRSALLAALDQLSTAPDGKPDADMPRGHTFIGRMVSRRKAKAAAS